MTVKELMDRLTSIIKEDKSNVNKDIFGYDPEYGNYVLVVAIDEDTKDGVFLELETGDEDVEVHDYDQSYEEDSNRTSI